MSYADYGGRSYARGVSRDDRVDVSPLNPQTGSWTGNFHALLGEGSILVGLYKQSSVTILRDGVEVALGACLIDPDAVPDGVDLAGEWFDPDPWRESGRVASFAVDGHRIDVLWTGESNNHVHARLTLPDGTTWTGWSGFEIGAGHTREDSEVEQARVKAMEMAFGGVDPEIPAPVP